MESDDSDVGHGSCAPDSSSSNEEHSQVDEEEDFLTSQRSTTEKNYESEGDEFSDSSSSDNFYRKHPSAINDSWLNRLHELMPTSANVVDDNERAEEASDDDYEIIKENRFSGGKFIPPSMRDDAPLAGILHDERLDKIDPRLFFPDYKPNDILRFSRLFGANLKSTSRAKIWWPAKTFRRNISVDHENNKDKASVNDTAQEVEYSVSEKKREIELDFAPPPPPEELQIDDEVLLMWPSNSLPMGKSGSNDSDDINVPPWRYGPGRIWYDRMGLPPVPYNFDYGFKLRRENQIKRKNSVKEEKSEEKPLEKSHNGSINVKPPPPEAFLPVNLVRWEDDIIIDPEQARQQLLKQLSSGKPLEYGWIPTQQTRNYESFMTAYKTNVLEQMFMRPGSMVPLRMIDTDFPKEPTANHSLFPMDNFDLLNTRWEDDIIWDSENMDHIPEPLVLTLDYRDDPKIFGMPEDKAPEEKPADGDTPTPKPFDRKEHQFTKKSKMILGQVQQRQKQEEDEQMESSVAQMTDKDPFNLSNDDYYMPKNVEKSVNALSGGSLIQHSIPAQNIHCTLFPTHINPVKLRYFHRLPITKRAIRGAIGDYLSVRTLTKLIKEKEELREKQKAAEGGGEIFFMRELQDLSGKDGTLLLMEYSEEHPPLLNQTGMASKIRNYFKRKVGKETEINYEFGETAFTHTLPFLGSLSPGQSLQSIENNLYRAPIYLHKPNQNDFLLIRTKQGFFIRKCPLLYLVGQECPLYEVPSPNSKRATMFVRDFLLAYIYRLFWASDQNPRRLKMEDIKASFPHYAESSVRKRLKQCSDFKRLGQGPDQNYWVLRSDFRLPSKEEVLAMVTPEMCCAQYSMLAAEQRLKDAGYGEKYFFTPENEDDSDDQVTIEDEIKCAPWNTTRAYIAAVKGKCLLDQTGIADPTGCGEGFSYVRISAKPQKAKEEVPNVPKRLVTGTNADLRKLPLKEAKEICRDYGVREEEINSLSRWEIIDVIRTLSTQAAKARSDFSGMARFARGNIRFNFADMQEKYKKFCQRTFDLQNQTLSNSDVLSTDEGSSCEDSDNEELATKLESMLDANKGKKGISVLDRKKLEFEQEEKERKALQKMIHGEANSGAAAAKNEGEIKSTSAKESGVGNADAAQNSNSNAISRKLKIYRTYKNPDGSESTRIEVITRPQLIEAYLRIRSTRDPTFIQIYAQMDEQYKEERRKEKRRLQDQLRRIRRNEMKAKLHGVPIGHPIAKARTIEKKPVVIKPNLLKMRCSACHGTGHMKTNKNCPLYGKDSNKSSIKTVGDIHPVALTDEQLEKMAVVPSGELIAVEGTKLKISRKVYNISEMVKKNAVRLHIPRELIDKKPDDSKDSLPTAGEAIKLSNDTSFNETASNDSFHTSSGEKAHSLAGPSRPRKRSIADVDDYLFGPQKSVKRRRADPKVTMSIQLNEIFLDMRGVPGSEDLLFPVNAKKVPDYYTIIKNPMDLQQIKKKIDACKYELRREFLADIKQILDNSRIYNGDNHVITETARKVLEVASRRLADREQKLFSLEKAINPLLDDNDIIGFSFILNEIVQECKMLPKSVAFHSKVDAKKIPMYYQKIENPMDLGTMEKNIKNHKYTTIEAFMKDIMQIKINSELYNGPAETSQYTAKAVEIYQNAERLVELRKDQLVELESNIQATLKDCADAESVATSSAILDENEPMSPRVPLKIIKEEDIDEDEAQTMKSSDAFNDLMMSDDDNDNNDMGSNWEMGDGCYDAENDLLRSQMHTSGQLAADLEMSESDEDDDEEFISAKMPKLDDLDTL